MPYLRTKKSKIVYHLTATPCFIADSKKMQAMEALVEAAYKMELKKKKRNGKHL